MTVKTRNEKYRPGIREAVSCQTQGFVLGARLKVSCLPLLAAMALLITGTD